MLNMTIDRIKETLPFVKVYDRDTRKTVPGKPSGTLSDACRVHCELECGTSFSFLVTWEEIQRVLATDTCLIY